MPCRYTDAESQLKADHYVANDVARRKWAIDNNVMFLEIRANNVDADRLHSRIESMLNEDEASQIVLSAKTYTEMLIAADGTIAADSNF